MVTWIFVFLALAILGGILGLVAAGPLGPILFFVFLALFVVSLFVHRRRRKQQWPRAS
jgi:uncharacterized membrane protein YtjA (UPF0391 family)